MFIIIYFTFDNANENIMAQTIGLATETGSGFNVISLKLMKTIEYAKIKPITILINQMLNIVFIS